MSKYGGLHPNDDAGHAMYEEQRSHGGPDPNPLIECAGQCGERYAFKDYWQPRYVEPEGANPHEDKWLCDDCVDLEKRRKNNQKLEAFINGE